MKTWDRNNNPAVPPKLMKTSALPHTKYELYCNGYTPSATTDAYALSAALISPFTLKSPAAITPPATLFEFQERLLFLIIGFSIFI